MAQATIVAISTPPGVSALAVLRISGPNAGQICDKLFRPGKAFVKPSQMAGYTLSYGKWYSASTDGKLIDEVVLACFKAPRSYTGEDLYEVSCHGSTYTKTAILQSLVDAGAELAGPGEFSKRAFLAGKMDLARTEAVIDLINAEAELQGDNALKQLQGALTKQVESLSSSLYEVLGRIELILEFPEHEDTPEAKAMLMAELKRVRDKVGHLMQSHRQGTMLAEGLTVALVGEPNAGKSTLLNALSEQDRAIVTNIPGTTRDTLEARINVAGLIVKLIDTAGIRETDDVVEQAGVKRSLDTLKRADYICWLLPADKELELEKQLATIRPYLDRQGLLIVMSKSDLLTEEQLALRQQCVQEQLGLVLADVRTEILALAANDRVALAELKQKILTYYEAQTAESDGTILTNVRHYQCFQKVENALKEALTGLEFLPLDLVATAVRASIESLAEITGEAVSDTLVENIFARFCVGK